MAITALTPSFRVIEDETVTIELVGSDHPRQLQYENEHVRIEVGCDQYLNFLQSRQELRLEPIASEGESITDFNLDTGLCPALIPIRELPDLLETGTARIYGKQRNLEISTISVQKYGVICGPLCGWGWRSFYLPDGTLFLHVEWIF
jgi:hypothetical protein